MPFLGRSSSPAEHGDTYSDELGERLGRLQLTSGLTLEQSSEHHAVVAFAADWQGESAEVSARGALDF